MFRAKEEVVEKLCAFWVRSIFQNCAGLGPTNISSFVGRGKPVARGRPKADVNMARLGVSAALRIV